MENLKQLTPYIAKANNQLSNYPLLLAFEKQTRIPKVAIVAVTYTIYTFCIFLGIFPRLLSTILGLAYPLYEILANSSTRANHHSHQLLAHFSLYLIAWTLISSLELVSIPFYYHIKSLIIANCLFNNGFDPIVKGLEPILFVLANRNEAAQSKKKN